MMWGYYWSWGGALVMILSMVLWVAVVGAIIVLVARWLGSQSSSRGNPTHQGSAQGSALEILEQRYARGEIDEATFRRMRDELQADKIPASPVS